MASFTNYRNRDLSATNFEDGLFVGGLDILDLIKQTSGQDPMAYSNTVTTTTERYIATQPGTGYSVGDTIVRTEIFDLSGLTPVSTVVWNNYNQSTTLTSAPSIVALSLQGTSGITNTELRSTPVIVRTDVLSPDVIRMGDIDDVAAPANGDGGYAMIPALKRVVKHLFALNAKLPDTLGRKGNVQSLSVALSDEQENYLSASVTRLIEVVVRLESLISRVPSSLGMKPSDGSLSVVVANQPSAWENISISVDAVTGNILEEIEKNWATDEMRKRTWAHVTNSGKTTSTATIWSPHTL